MDPFSLCLFAIIALAVLGLPVGYAMMAGSLVYLLVAGQDLSIAAEQLLQGLRGSFVLLAIPLFIMSAELMNVGSLSNRLLQFCNAVVGRFRGGMGHVNVVQSVIFAGMSGSAIADRSFRPPFPWCSSRSSPMPPSATSSSAVRCRD